VLPVRPVAPVVPKDGFLRAVAAAVFSYVAVFCAELFNAKILDIVYNKEIKNFINKYFFRTFRKN
jgi:hypothetical protein